MLSLSFNLLLFAFFAYLTATVFFAFSLSKQRKEESSSHTKSSKWGISFVLLGLVLSLGYFFARWSVSGHAPVSNMFEYMTTLGIAMALAFTIIYFIYPSRADVTGLFTMPTVMLLIVYASTFSTAVAPLVPSLQMPLMLKLHIITTAIGQGLLAIGFAAGLAFLIRSIDIKENSWKPRVLEIIMYGLICVVANAILTHGFSAAGYEAQFNYVDQNGQESQVPMTYNLPALVGPNEWVNITEDKMDPLISMPAIIEAGDLNTLIWSFALGLVLYWLLRLVIRKRLTHLIQPLLKGTSPSTLDEFSYRAIAIGFPIFALGGLVFAMIWAEIAWSRFWGWDPKEVWALITFLFYAAYLHLRLKMEWHGEKSAWLCVIGFAIIMFNLVIVNLFIVGLHSYA
ncbi:cytochrome c-type biogenesis protein CcsB [Alkalihalobacillus xiaoxiensis]|uniref:Cytochrome c-type biogenesis protein CcsB n=1 Tax=Shouchella xiaoxiensis TaxID=766895 RepID=A0ABS2SST8_9BACI|nr:c-type cytochrome biogenesis protein CcsB [Shouchella xiaoxiensis]MBM7838261.1 cytochrome c-type biogenesis protein CcsB [Shouchella xiaoxiensis]